MTSLRHSLEAALVATAGTLARATGSGAARSAGRALGSAWYRLDAWRRRVARENLRLALPHLSPRRREAIARASFRHVGELSVDLLRFPLYDAQAAERLAVVDGWQNLEDAHGRRRGVLVFSGHFGHWELVALLQGHRGRPMDMVTRPLDNPLLEARLAKLRCLSGNRIVHKRRAVRGVLSALRANRSVAIVIDQHFREPNRILVDFFGHPVSTTPILGLIAARTGAPVVPVFSWPQEDGRYRIAYLPEVQVEPSGDRTNDAYRITLACSRIIEEQIRCRPEYWFWMHRRWKKNPQGASAAAPTPAASPFRRRA